MNWRGYNPSNYRTKVQDALDAATKDAVLRVCGLSTRLCNAQYATAQRQLPSAQYATVA